MSESREEFEAMMRDTFGDAVSLSHDGVVYTDGFVGAVHIGWLKGSLAEAERFKRELELRSAQAQVGDGEAVAVADKGVLNWIDGKQFDHEADLYTQPAVNQQLLEGYIPMPTEPTEAMIDAGVAVAFAASVHGNGGWNNYMKALYRAFIAAAQEQGK
jgi:hypothetical protein